MQTYYFGAERALFGVLHEPAAAVEPGGVVVVCAPLWREGIRAHRVLRQLGLRLAKEGAAVLRFDYFGAGDSAGEGEQGEVESWVSDVLCAVDEARRAHAKASVTLLGLRFGATLAALAAERKEALVDRLVLWEPVSDGGAFLDESFAEHRAWAESYASWRHMPVTAIADADDEVLGFRVPAAMRGSIASVRLAELRRAPPRTLVVERTASGTNGGLLAALSKLGARVEHHVVDEPEVWKPHELQATAGGRKTQDVISKWLARGAS
jgi:alpha/beta superfamily hydrolase